jgi:hypothetical protein
LKGLFPCGPPPPDAQKRGSCTDLIRSGSPHHVHDFVLPEFHELLIVVMQMEGDLGDGNSVLIFLIRQLDAIILPEARSLQARQA